jgi:hypothetical protein
MSECLRLCSMCFLRMLGHTVVCACIMLCLTGCNCIHAQVIVCIYVIHASMYVYIYTHIYIHMYTHTRTRTDEQNLVLTLAVLTSMHKTKISTHCDALEACTGDAYVPCCCCCCMGSPRHEKKPVRSRSTHDSKPSFPENMHPTCSTCAHGALLLSRPL